MQRFDGSFSGILDMFWTNIWVVGVMSHLTWMLMWCNPRVIMRFQCCTIDLPYRGFVSVTDMIDQYSGDEVPHDLDFLILHVNRYNCEYLFYVKRMPMFISIHFVIYFLAATKAALWMVQSVRLCVCVSVCHTFSPCFHHHIIMKFSGIVTNDRSEVNTKGLGQRSKVKVTEVKTQLSRFQTVSPV